MKIAGLRRLAQRAKGSGLRQRAAASNEPTAGEAARRFGDARRRRLATAASDVEAPGKLACRLVKEAQHGALCCGSDEDPPDNIDIDDANEPLTQAVSGRISPTGDADSMTESFMAFYTNKLTDLKKKEGGESHFPISGNLYMYKSIASFADFTELFLRKQTWFVDFGLILIIIVQILAPLSMLINAIWQIKFGEKDGHLFGVHEFSQYEFGSQDKGISHVFQRVLGLVFLLLFLMNGLYVLENDRLETRKVTEMAFLFKAVRHRIKDENGASPPAPKTRWLWLGAFLNCTCLLLCSFAMCFVFIIEEGPKDLVLDAFGFAFIYNLDDIGGDLAFLDEKWDEDFLGDVYGSMKEDEKTKGLLEKMTKKREDSFTPDTVYFVCRLFVMLLHIALPLIYIFVEMKPKEDSS